jgi:3-hydroxyisobutyrate dehydrogenase-like beta-hydroxyacid dehydrogenase
MTTKIVRNMMYYASWRAAYEAKKLAEGMGGVDLANMAEINALSEADGSGSTFWLRCWAAGDYHPVGNMAKRDHVTQGLIKDLSAAKELAELAGLDIPIMDIMLNEPEQTTSAWSADKSNEA